MRAIKHFADSGAVVILVELAFNRREFVFADCGLDGTPAECSIHGTEFRHKYIGLRSQTELWLKENLVNVAVHSLPYNWQQVCWLDSDVHFMRPNWVGECIHKLQHYKYLQMFSHAVDLGPDYEELAPGTSMSRGVSFMHAHIGGFLEELIRKETAPKDTAYPGAIWPGLAWAASRDGWDQTGGLFDIAIWGGGDYDMAHALTEQAMLRVHRGVHPNYKMMLKEWEGFCKRNIRRNVGVMSGTIAHNWHGRKTERLYTEKRKLMQKVKFDPIHFLRRDYQGLYQLHDDGSEQFVHFRDAMRAIAKLRNEDANEV